MDLSLHTTSFHQGEAALLINYYNDLYPRRSEEDFLKLSFIIFAIFSKIDLLI